jgi:hypothetical protein
MIQTNPSLAEDPAVAELLKTSELIKAEEQKAGVNTEQQQNQAAPTEQKPATTDEVKTEKSPLSSLPFFKDDGVAESFDLKTLTPENFHEYAAKLGVDPTQEGWVGDTLSKIASQTAPQTEFEKQYNDLSASILALPKEVQSIVNLALEGKDWKPAVQGAATLDLTKDFGGLSADEKIKIHNYYFPEDIIKSGEDITSKENSKALRSAEAQYKADKVLFETKEANVIQERKASQQNFLSSVDASMAELKKAYPDFKEKDLKAAEETVKKGGIYNEFFDKNGNLKSDGFKKLIFAQHGENILKVATSIAKNQGKNQGKNEVLSVEQGVDKNKNQGATELTNVEKNMNKLVHESSMSGSQLTY